MKDIKNKIEIIAKELTASRSVPINLYDICNRLNISVTSAGLKNQKAMGVFTKDGFVIRVNHSSGKINSFDSFLIAHEIGHFILSEKLNMLHGSTKDYWKQEYFCDYFSRLILLPDSHVKSIIGNSSEAPLDQYKISLFLSKKFNTNWKTCAHRISDYKKNFAFFQLVVEGESQEKYFTFELSTLPNNLLIKTKVSRKNKDRKYIYNTLSKINESKVPIFDIDAKFLNHSLFKRFPNWQEGILVKNNYNSIRMVIKSNLID